MEKLKKIDSQTAEVTLTTTIVEKQIINISDLINDRDSLIRTRNMETDEFNTRIKKIDDQITEFNSRIKQLTDIGLKAQVLAPEVSTVEIVEVEIPPALKPIEEEVKEEVVHEAPTTDAITETKEEVVVHEFEVNEKPEEKKEQKNI